MEEKAAERAEFLIQAPIKFASRLEVIASRLEAAIRLEAIAIRNKGKRKERKGF